jgi:WD40 repeat protein
LNTIQVESDVYALDYHLEGTYFATGGKDGIVRLFDEEKMELVAHMKSADKELPGHSNRVYSVKFSKSDPNMIISGGWDSTIYIYDIRVNGPVNKISGPYICGDGLDLYGNTISAASYRSEECL